MTTAQAARVRRPAIFTLNLRYCLYQIPPASMLKIFFCMTSVVLLASCAKKKTVTCEDQSYMPATIGYTLQELDTVELRWFERGSGFTKPVDTFLMHNRNDIGGRNDTFFLPELRYSGLPPHGARLYTYHHDLEVYIPSVQRAHRISNIEHIGATSIEVRAKSNFGCTNYLHAYTLDGARDTWVKEPTYIFMKKQ